MKAAKVFLLITIVLAAVALVVIADVATGAGTPIPPTPPPSAMLTVTPDPYPGMEPTAIPDPYTGPGVVVVGHDMKGYPDEQDEADSFTPDDAGLWAFIWDLFR